MKDDDIRNLQQSVIQYLRSNLGFNVADMHDVTALNDFVSQETFYDSFCSETDADIKCVTVMCAAGLDELIPPGEMCKQLLKLVHEYKIDQIERLLEIVIAFGCGKWREPDGNNVNPWYHVWPRAIIALARAGEIPIKESNYWLSKNVLGYTRENFWNSVDGKNVIWSDSNYLALKLTVPIKPLHVEHKQTLQISFTNENTELLVTGGRYYRELPPGAKAVFEVDSPAIIRRSDVDDDMRDLSTGTYFIALARDDETRINFSNGQSELRLKEGQSAVAPGPVSFLRRECTCGNVNCTERHRLKAWIPAPRISLRSFLASAIKGPNNKIKVGSFIQGMYYPVLVNEGNYLADRVRFAPVEFKLCQNPECTNPDIHRKYEGGKCPFCGFGSNPETVPRKEFNWLILMTYPSVYERVARYKCRQCKNLHSAEQCPLCDEPRGARPIIVWVRTFNKNVPLADNVT